MNGAILAACSHSMIYPTSFALVLLAFPAPGQGEADAQNWPQFRGPRALGIATGRATPTDWNPEDGGPERPVPPNPQQ